MNTQIHTLPKVAAALLLCCLAVHASAQTVVLDSYGPDITFLDGWPNPLTAGNSIAVPFQITNATTVQSILTAIERNPDWASTGGVTLGIAARQGALPTGAGWLYSTHLNDPAVNTTVAPKGWSLTAGSYWLVATADAGFAGQWISATQDYTGNWAYTTVPGVWTQESSTFLGMPGARITVTSAVPEPSTYGLMFAGGLLLAAVARRKSNAQQG
ncbi:MAG: PEP-CTERM sorting domain-containing protein [Burkholderiales bacterium]|nr:PEP-CTERM sorting domain-containing protein [Burkholderiales bacterium]